MDPGQFFELIGTNNLFITLLSEIFATSSMRVSGFDGRKRSGNSEETGKREEAEQTNEVDDPIDARSAFHTDDVLGNNLPKGFEDWDESTDEVPHERIETENILPPNRIRLAWQMGCYIMRDMFRVRILLRSLPKAKSGMTGEA